MVALKIAAMPKASGARPRCVVFTQGKDPTLVAVGGVIHQFPVPLLEKEKLVDTNGAGDAFVGGFLAYLAKGGDMSDCVKRATGRRGRSSRCPAAKSPRA